MVLLSVARPQRLRRRLGELDPALADINDDVLTPVDQVADARAAPVRVGDRVLSGQRVRPDIDHVKVIVDVANGWGPKAVPGNQWVDLDLDGVAILGAGDDRAVDRGRDIGGGELQAKGQSGKAVGKESRFSLGLGVDLALGGDIGRLARVDYRTRIDGHVRVRLGKAYRQCQRELRAAILLLVLLGKFLLGLRLDVRLGVSSSRDDNGFICRDDIRVGADVHPRYRVGVDIADGDSVAGDGTRSVGSGRRVNAERAAGEDLRT